MLPWVPETTTELASTIAFWLFISFMKLPMFIVFWKVWASSLPDRAD
jgi:hypothetical protein